MGREAGDRVGGKCGDAECSQSEPVLSDPRAALPDATIVINDVASVITFVIFAVKEKH